MQVPRLMPFYDWMKAKASCVCSPRRDVRLELGGTWRHSAGKPNSLYSLQCGRYNPAPLHQMILLKNRMDELALRVTREISWLDQEAQIHPSSRGHSAHE